MARRRIIAVLLGFVLGPGAGHWYADRPRHALAWWLGWMALLLAVPFWFPLFFVAIALRFLHVVDLAFVEIEESPPLYWKSILSLAAFLSIVFLVVVRLYVLEAFRIPSSAMVPTLAIGDHVIIEKYAPADVARGDLIVFSNPCVPEKDFVKRVIAVGGDTVEVRCDQVHVNGTALPREPAGEHAYRDHDEELGWAPELTHATRYRERLGDATYDTIYVDAHRDRDDPRGPHDFPDLGPAQLAHLTAPLVPRCPSERRPPDQLGAIVGTAAPAEPCAPQVHYVVPRGAVFTLGDNRYNSLDSRSFGPVPLTHVKGRVIGRWLPLSRAGSL